MEGKVTETNKIGTNKNVKNGKKKLWWILGITLPLLLGTVLTLEIRWRMWVTDCVYAQSKVDAVSDKVIENIKGDIKSTKDDVKSTKEGLDTFKKEVTDKVEVMRKEVKQDINRMEDKISQGQFEQMKLLKEINKKVN